MKGSCHHVQETDRGQVKWWRFLRHKGDRNMLVRQLMAGVLTLSAYVGYCAETERTYTSLHALSQRMVGSVSWPKNQYITVRALVQRMHKRVCDRMGVTIRSTLKARLGLGWFGYMFGCLFEASEKLLFFHCSKKLSASRFFWLPGFLC